MHAFSNRDIAGKLSEYADILERQQANRFRIAAYRPGANTLAATNEPVARICQDGIN